MWMNPNNKGYIRATTISSEKFIIIGSQNIELSGNVIMKNGATLSSGILKTNSIVPNETNSVSLGTSSKIWSNAYIKDLSINNNIEISGNTRINGILQASNIYTKSEVDASLVNVYTKNQVYTKTEIDASLANVYTKSLDVCGNVTFRGSTLYVPSSFTIDPFGYGNNTGTVLINGNLVVQGVTTTINSSVVDISDKILVLASNATNSVQADGAGFEISGAKVNLLYNNSSNTFRSSIGMSISGNVVPVSNGVGSLGESGKIWSNAYIRNLSVTNIEVSGNIVPLRDVSSNLGSSLNRWNNIFVNDLSVNNINGLPYSSGGGGGGGGATDIININKIINTSNNKITTANRVYQEISGGSNWNAVNGYYGLAKQSFPALNPLTSGVKAIAYWTARHNTGYFDFKNIVWAPKLKMFLTFSDGGYAGSGAQYSYDGINWINIFSGYALQWNVRALCWSEELGIFVAGSYRHPYVIYSYNGIEWYSNTTRDSAITFLSICWSPELGIFVAVTESNITGTSTDGINWIGATIGDSPMKWGSVCWAPELRLFVATGFDYQNTNTKVMTSNDGYNWTLRTVPTAAEYPSWVSVCWSPQLGIFVTVASNGGGLTANIMTSTNGIDWIIRGNNNGVSYRNVSWCAELGLFLITQTSGGGSYLYSRNGIDWIEIYENISETGEWSSFNAYSVVRSPELGIFVAVGGNKIWTSVLKGRPPTSYNVFDSSFNRIDENGKWDFSNIAVTTLNVTGTFTNTSDDRLKHNEVTIVNGLDVIDQLTPKFYQKTQDMLDAHYYGDLSGHNWSYETGLIAQELLQISDLSFVVSGGDYYRESYIYKRQTNDPSNANYDPSNANYDICYNLIPQTYNVNYNSIFVYGLAAIKELHAKVKSQETTISSLITRIELLEQQKV
jgi:hypothetical protein